MTTRRAEVKYGPDWTPQTFTLDATVNGGDVTARSTFAGSVARTDGAQTGTPYSREHAISPQSVVLLPSSFFGAFEAVIAAARQRAGGTELKAYVLPQGETTIKLVSAVTERIQIGKDVFDVWHFEALWQIPGTNDLGLSITVDEGRRAGSVQRAVAGARRGARRRRGVHVAHAGLLEPRRRGGDDSGRRLQPRRDAHAAGQRPPAGARMPAVILLGGAGSNDRDGAAHGVPTLGAARRRRSPRPATWPSATTSAASARAAAAPSRPRSTDYAEDVRAVVRWLNERKDVDPKRIAVVGHGEGAWVALLAASRERKLAAVVSLAGPGSTGADLVLDQQQRALETIDAVAAGPRRPGGAAEADSRGGAHGQGLGGRAARTCARKPTRRGCRASCTFDPAKTIEDVRQPMLFVHGALDQQVAPANAERLVELARTDSKSKSVELVDGARRQPPADAGRHRRGRASMRASTTAPSART